MFPGFILRSNSCLKNRRIVNIICALVLYLFGLIFHTFFYLDAKEPKHQGPETPTKLFLYFLKSQKLAPMLFPLLLRQLLFFNENNSTIFNVCIPLAN